MSRARAQRTTPPMRMDLKENHSGKAGPPLEAAIPDPFSCLARRAKPESHLTTPHKLRIEARSRKRTGLLPVVRRTTQTDGRGRQLHAVVRLRQHGSNPR